MSTQHLQKDLNTPIDEVDALALDRKAQNCPEDEILDLPKTDSYQSEDCGDAKPDDAIRLNIRGTKMVVPRSALTWAKGSMLAAQFSGRWDHCIDKDEDGYFMIDLDYVLFDPIIKFLTSRRVKYPIKLGGFDKEKQSDFDDLLDYYGLKDTLLGFYGSKDSTFPLTLKFGCIKGEKEIVGLSARTTNRASEGVTVLYGLALNGNKCWLESLEVKFAKPLVEFNSIDMRKSIDSRMSLIDMRKSLDTSMSLNFGSITGIGLSGSQICLEIGSNFYPDSALPLCDYDDHDDHITVRYEDFGRRWYINDKLLEWEQEIHDRIENFFADNCSSLESFHTEIHHFEGEFEITSFIIPETNSH